jgi:hypothetical protein
MQDVLDSEKRKDADDWPNVPAASNIELPVEASELGDALLIDGAT